MRKDPRERATVSSLLKHPFVEHSRKLAVPRVLRGIIQSQRAANLADLRHASKEAIAPNPRAGETPAKLPMEEGDVRVLHGGRFDAKLPAIPESGSSGEFPRERQEGGASLLALSLYRRQVAVREESSPRGEGSSGESLLSTSSSSQAMSGGREESLREGSLREESLREESLREGSLREGSLREESLREFPIREESLRELPIREESLRELAIREESLREFPIIEESLREFPIREESLREFPIIDPMIDPLRDPSLRDPQRDPMKISLCDPSPSAPSLSATSPHTTSRCPSLPALSPSPLSHPSTPPRGNRSAPRKLSPALSLSSPLTPTPSFSPREMTPSLHLPPSPSPRDPSHPPPSSPTRSASPRFLPQSLFPRGTPSSSSLPRWRRFSDSAATWREFATPPPPPREAPVWRGTGNRRSRGTSGFPSPTACVSTTVPPPSAPRGETRMIARCRAMLRNGRF